MIVACNDPGDAGWLALRRRLYPEHDDTSLAAEMRAFCADPARHGQFLCLAPDGSAIGLVEVSLRRDFVNGTRSSPVAFLESIVVTPAWRRQGIATELVAAAESWGRARGCSEFASDALLDNAASHALHAALGFEATRRVVFFRKPIG
jgi:aminoglycoside 6'-N-acetyltransferase I